MKKIFTIRKEERWLMLAIVLVLGVFQVLIISKFFTLFADYSEQHWDVFMRNFHMSGFDPISYAVLTDWHQGYDILRHPLLALLMYPPYLLNQALWALTGCNCCQIIMGALLLAAGSYAWLMLFRIIHELVGLSRAYALLLSALGFGFAYVLISTIVPDHFCLSLALLLTLFYIAGDKLQRGERFTLRAAALWFLLTAGVTLSNGVAAVIMVAVVNGREVVRWKFLVLSFVVPSALLLGLAVGISRAGDMSQVSVAEPIEQQMAWVRNNVSRADVAMENFFGESLQLHRQHVLGDVLTKRPVIVRYSCTGQYVVEGLLMGLLLLGFWMGRRERLVWMAMGIVAFNMGLHLVLGFALDEVYIMAAHWAFCLPIVMAYVLRSRRRPVRLSVALILLGIVGYLWSYHSVLLYRYLTWPVKM